MAPPQRSSNNRKGSPSTWSAGCRTQEVHLLPQLGALLHLQDLPLLRVHPHPQVCPLQGYLGQVMEQGQPHPLHPHSLQHRAPVVGVPGPQAWLLPLLEPNSGK